MRCLEKHIFWTVQHCNNMPFYTKHERSCVLCNQCCWIMNSTATSRGSCHVTCSFISWQCLMYFAWEHTKGGRQPSASCSRCWVWDKLTPVLVRPDEQNGTRESCSSPSSLKAYYLGSERSRKAAAAAVLGGAADWSHICSPVWPHDTSCKSK